MFVLIVASMGMVMLQMHTSQARRQIQATDNKRALYIAEAGLAEAFMCIAQGKSGNVGSEELPARYADGIYWVEATHGDNDEVGLVSTGLCGAGRFALSLVLSKQAETISSLGFYAEQDVVIGAGSIIDGYDSRLGALVDQLDPSLAFSSTGSGAILGAGGDIVVQGALDPSAQETYVFGDAHAGPTGVVSQEAGTTVTGSTTPLPFSAGLPDVSAPDIATISAWPFGIGSGSLSAGTYHFRAAEVSHPSLHRGMHRQRDVADGRVHRVHPVVSLHELDLGQPDRGRRAAREVIGELGCLHRVLLSRAPLGRRADSS